MSSLNRAVAVFACAAAAAWLSACAANQSPASTGVANLPPGTPLALMGSRHGWMSPDVHHLKLVYVSDNIGNQVVVYPQGQNNPGPIGLITEGLSKPNGSYIDANGKLYVANAGNGTVTEYKRGETSPSTTLTGLTGPLNVWVDGKGVVYVVENSAGQLAEFRKGQTTPSFFQTGLTHAQGITTDRARNVYVTWTDASIGHLTKCRPFKYDCKDTGITMQLAGDVKVDAAGHLVVTDNLAAKINIYVPGSTQPLRTIDTTDHQPYRIALDVGDHTLYMADPANFAVDLYDYSTGTMTGSITLGLQNASGVALDPHQPTGPGPGK